MAAWLAYLKSRLLLPNPADPDEPSAEALAEALALQLRCLDAVRTLGGKLMARPQRGRDVFPRGMPEDLAAPVRISFRCDLFDLLAAYGRQLRRERQIAASRTAGARPLLRSTMRFNGCSTGWKRRRAGRT